MDAVLLPQEGIPLADNGLSIGASLFDKMRSLWAFGNANFQDAEVLMLPNLGFKMNRWCAVHFSGTLHHVKLFFNVAPCNFAVVANADQQATSF